MTIIGIDICVGFVDVVSKRAARAVWCARFLVVSKLPDGKRMVRDVGVVWKNTF